MGIVSCKNKNSFLNKALLGLAMLALGLTWCGCSTERRLSQNIKQEFKKSSVFQNHHVGFVLYDPANDKLIFEKDGHKYFIPASNTKLFTFYAGLKMLADSIPSLRYVERNDSLIFWGTGDPGLLHGRLKGDRAYQFLKSARKQLFFAEGRYSGKQYGKGWSWDDYNDYDQAEINELPVMGNMLSIVANDGKIQVSPKEFSKYFLADSSFKLANFKVIRDFDQNTFRYPTVAVPTGYKQSIPFKTSIKTTLSLLSDTLHKPVGLIHMKMPADAKTIYDLSRDMVLREMMVPSDNYIAEQLILVYANQVGAELNTEKTIQYILKTYLASLPDPPAWVDGSGLSRMNLFSPQDVAMVLKLIYKEVQDKDRLFYMLPAGGKSGTLKNAYPATDQPFVFGKTGSLSNNHNQSGYVLTKKGKTYIYAFMNNNFMLPTATVRKEMGRIITLIHEKF